MKDKASDPAYFSTGAAEGTVLMGTALDLDMLFWLVQTHAGFGLLPNPLCVSLCVCEFFFFVSLGYSPVLLLILSSSDSVTLCMAEHASAFVCGCPVITKKDTEHVHVVCVFVYGINILDVRFQLVHSLLYETCKIEPPTQTHINILYIN